MKNKIILKLNNTGTERKELAKKCNITETRLSNFLNIKTDNETDFDVVVSIVRHLFPDDEYNLIKKYALTINRPKNLRFSLEYAEFHKQLSLLDLLLHIQSSVKNKQNQEWIKVYSILLKYKNDPIKVSIELEKIKLYTYEMEVLREIYLMRKYYFLRNFNFFIAFEMEGLYNKIREISDKFIRECFMIRFNEFYGWVNLHLNRLDKSRDAFQSVIKLNVDGLRTGQALNGLGISFLYTDFNKALLNFNKAKDIFNKKNNISGYLTTSRNINFLSGYWSRLDTIVHIDQEFNIDKDLHEDALFKKINGDLKGAKKIIEEYDENEMDENALAFHFYYKGKILNDEKMLYESITLFKRCNDLFYCQLPCFEILEDGVNNSLVNALFGDYIC